MTKYPAIKQMMQENNHKMKEMMKMEKVRKEEKLWHRSCNRSSAKDE
jgi:hypothetical protein